MKFIIEHLEDQLSEWCYLEYKHISEHLGKENISFTNVKNDKKKLSQLGTVYRESIKKLDVFPKKKCILLDLNAEKNLSPNDNNFEYVILGGILGDYPPSGKTEKAFADLDVEKRRMTDKQMSTDTAAIVASKICNDKTPIEKLHFAYELEINFDENESVTLPYQYLVENSKAVITPGLIEHLRDIGW